MNNRKRKCVSERKEIDYTNLQSPYYETRKGRAYLGDSKKYMKNLPEESVNLVLTSPPFALLKKKEYGNVSAQEYLKWFKPFAKEILRILTKDGSFVIDLGGTWVKGQPTRSLYHFEFAIMLLKELNFHLAQEFYWYNPSKLPTPAEWVTVRKIRVKDAVNMVWWFSKDPYPKADNQSVLNDYSDAMEDLLENGYKAKKRPSGHDISEKFSKRKDGAIPPNLLEIPNTSSSNKYLKKCKAKNIKPHPARFPADLPKFFIKFLTEKDDIVLDPFGGSNVTGKEAEKLNRQWITIEKEEKYLEGSKFRFSI